jgi:GABA(A) receptor-associated protein
MDTFVFQRKHSFRKRNEESSRILRSYPDRCPVICEGDAGIELDKHKFLVPMDLSMGQFLYVIRKRLKLPPENSIYLLLENNTFPTASSTMSEIYKYNKNQDGFLYIHASKESTFG